MQNLIEIYHTIVELPVEYQVVLGIGALVVLAAIRNMWGILFPLRWAVASLLRVVAFLLHSRKRQKRLKLNQDAAINYAIAASPAQQVSQLAVGNKEEFIKTAKYYAKHLDELDEDKIDFLLSVASTYDITTAYHASRRSFIRKLQAARDNIKNQRRALEQQERFLNPPKPYAPPVQVAAAPKPKPEPEPKPDPRTKISPEEVL